MSYTQVDPILINVQEKLRQMIYRYLSRCNNPLVDKDMDLASNGCTI